jgi:hypothetical protein
MNQPIGHRSGSQRTGSTSNPIMNLPWTSAQLPTLTIPAGFAPDGYFTLKGRSKDLIISDGYNIYPPEVELVLAKTMAAINNFVVGLTQKLGYFNLAAARRLFDAKIAAQLS